MEKNNMIVQESELYGNPVLRLLQLCSTALDEVKVTETNQSFTQWLGSPPR